MKTHPASLRRAKYRSAQLAAATSSDDVSVSAINVPTNLSGDELDMYFENLFADKIGFPRPYPDFPLPAIDGAANTVAE